MAWGVTGNIRGPQGPGVAPIVATLGSDVAGTTSLANVTGLSLAVVAGTYRVSLLAQFTVTAGTTPSYRLAFTGPAITFALLNAKYQLADTPTWSADLPAKVLAHPTASGTVTASANSKFATVTGFVTFSASGTLQVQHILGGTVPAGAAKTGSRLILEQLA